MELRFSLEGDEAVGPWLKKNMDELGTVVRDAMKEQASETADVILFRCQEDIEEAGNFGERWQEAFHVDVSETQRTIRVDAYMKPDGPPVTFWKTFEYGATHKAGSGDDDYMWLPFIGINRAEAGTDVWPSVYGSENLFKIISKKGNPVLMDVETKEPRYVGKKEVTIPKLFHLHEIIHEEAQKARANFRNILRELRNG